MVGALLSREKMDMFGKSACCCLRGGEIKLAYSIYTQLDDGRVKSLPQSNRTGRVDGHSITAEQVLEQANRIFAPFTLRFAAALSWFAVWKSMFHLDHHRT